MLEITLHDGPARLGKWNNLITPTILDAEQVAVVDDQPMPYDVPRTLAEWSLAETILKAQEGNRDDIAVIHGAKYLDLRLESVSEGVLVSGTVHAPTSGECSRCLGPAAGDIEIVLTELFAYPDSATESTTEEDEVGRVIDQTVNIEQAIVDAVG